LVVTASEDETARVWDALVQPELSMLANLGARVTDVAYGSNGRVLLVTTADGVRHILNSSNGAELRTEAALPPSNIVRGPEGTTATILGKNVVLRSDGRTVVLRGHERAVTSASFSPDGTQLVTASRDRDARIWDAATGESQFELLGHFGPVQDARFSPDGRWVVTAGPERAGLWNARTGALVTLLRGHEGRVTSAGFERTGRTIVTGGVDGTVRTYECEICGSLDELVELAERRLAATRRELTPEERGSYLP
jgi:WD40 repeat protein